MKKNGRPQGQNNNSGEFYYSRKEEAAGTSQQKPWWQHNNAKHPVPRNEPRTQPSHLNESHKHSNGFFEKKNDELGHQSTSQHWSTNKGYHPRGRVQPNPAPARPLKPLSHPRQRHVYNHPQGDEGAYYALDCIICLEKVSMNAKIWTCPKCSVSTHLSCIEDWIQKLQQRRPATADKSTERDFACPHCNFGFKDFTPKYTCFCGKENLPTPVFGQGSTCGQVCGRARDDGCPHPCDQTCHYGRCAPCTKSAFITCFCGKRRTEIDCRDRNKPAERVCGAICAKSLSCGNHRCERVCHAGECTPCTVTVSVPCLCGKKSKEAICGTTFACAAVCGRTLNCGKHRCTRGCHADNCGGCPTLVRADERCVCGKHTVSEVLGRSRLSCEEPLALCADKCGRQLSCGHRCMRGCHDGPCSCGRTVAKECSCGRETFNVECCWLPRSAPLPDQPLNFALLTTDRREKAVKCKQVCQGKLTCGNHRCQQICCDRTNHKCKIVCNADQPCGHPCPAKCHQGPCPPCPEMLSRPLSCACGAATIRPPRICSIEPPVCSKKCGKPLACGHSCYFSCHQPPCPPCEELVSKPCICGRTVLTDTLCSKRGPCMQSCGKQLSCGHPCKVVCHTPGECESLRVTQLQAIMPAQHAKESNTCVSACGKKRDCGHECRVRCHASKSCPAVPCEETVTAACACGRNTAVMPCHKSTVLDCDAKCLNWKRFRALYVQEETARRVYYSTRLVKYGQRHPVFLGQIEEKLAKMFFEAASQLRIAVGLSNNLKLNFVITLAINHYRLTTEVAHTEKSTVVILRANDSSVVPPLPLSAYLRKLQSGEISQEHPPFEARLRFYNLTIFDETDYLKELFVTERDKFYLEDDGHIVLMLWRFEDVEKFSAELQTKRNHWSDFTVEIESQRPKPVQTAVAPSRKRPSSSAGQTGTEDDDEDDEWRVDPAALLRLKDESPANASESGEEGAGKKNDLNPSNLFSLLI